MLITPFISFKSFPRAISNKGFSPSPITNDNSVKQEKKHLNALST